MERRYGQSRRATPRGQMYFTCAVNVRSCGFDALIMFQMLKSLHAFSFHPSLIALHVVAWGLFGHVAHMNNGIPARDALDCALARRTEKFAVQMAGRDHMVALAGCGINRLTTALCPPFSAPMRQVVATQQDRRYGPIRCPRVVKKGRKSDDYK